jgi:hypothetical protein
VRRSDGTVVVADGSTTAGLVAGDACTLTVTSSELHRVPVDS